MNKIIKIFGYDVILFISLIFIKFILDKNFDWWSFSIGVVIIFIIWDLQDYENIKKEEEKNKK